MEAEFTTMLAPRQDLLQDNSGTLKGKIWIRSGGRCECTSSCAHHEGGRCGSALLPGGWSAQGILPLWVEGYNNRLSMFEALCEPCRLSQNQFPHPSSVRTFSTQSQTRAADGKSY